MILLAACSKEAPPKAAASNGMTLSSTAFVDGDGIPKQYGCSGAGTAPPLAFANVPPAAKSLALIVNDPDVPGGQFTHWAVWNIPPGGSVQSGVQGKNSIGKNGWAPPCPPVGEHRYVFDLYALDTMVDVPQDKGRDDLEKAMAGHVVAQASITGRYKR